ARHQLSPGEDQCGPDLLCIPDRFQARPRDSIASLYRLIWIAEDRTELDRPRSQPGELLGEHLGRVDPDVNVRPPGDIREPFQTTNGAKRRLRIAVATPDQTAH